MQCVALFLVLPLLTTQEESSQDEIRALVEKLHSDSIEEREEAARELEELDRTALPALERAGKSSDPELALRAMELIRLIHLPVELKKVIRLHPRLHRLPGPKESHLWTEAFLEMLDLEEFRPRYDWVERRDLEAMAPLALAGARTKEKKEKLCNLIERWQLRSAIPEIAKFLRDPEGPGSLNYHAVKALKSLHAKEAVPDLLRCLSLGDDDFRVGVASMLAELDAREAIPLILPLLDHHKAEVRSQIAWCLAKLGARIETERILELLKDADAKEWRYLSFSLRRLGARAALPGIRDALNSIQPGARATAAMLLGILRQDAAVPEITRLLRDHDPDVRLAAAEALVELDARSAVDDIAGLLKDSVSRVRREAPRLLFTFSARKILPRLLPLLKDEDEDVRSAAVGPVGEWGGKEHVPLILPLLKDSDYRVRSDACWALRKLGATGAVPQIMKLLKDPEEHTRSWAAAALGSLGTKSLIPQLRKLLSDKRAGRHAPRVLGDLRAEEARDDIVGFLSSEDPAMRRAAVTALGMLGGDGIVPLLIPFLVDPDVGVRQNALWMLNRPGGEASVPQVRRLLLDGCREVRMAAASFLCLHGSRAGVQRILEERGNLLVLNALRAPGTWRRWTARKLGRDHPGTALEGIQRLARSAESDLSLPSERAEWIGDRRSGELLQSGMTLVEGLRATLGLSLFMAEESRDSYEAILDPDRVRIVPTREALAFWRAWWAEEQKKQPKK